MLASEQVIKFPFSIPLTELARPNITTFFRDAHWGQCLELLSHLCVHGSQVLLVIGPSGIGKTAMKYALENRQIPNLHLVDDAHNLSIDQAVRLLHEKEQRIVLFARPELVDRINRCGLQADFTKHARIIEIEPLTLTEMGNFLLHQWQILGHDGNLPYKQAEIQKIYALSRGIPGAAKQLFTDSLRGRAMLDNAKTETNTKRFSPLIVGLVVACGLLFCLFALVWPQRDKPVAMETTPLPQQHTLAAQVPIEPDLEFDTGFDAQQSAEREIKLAQLEEKMAAIQRQAADDTNPAASSFADDLAFSAPDMQVQPSAPKVSATTTVASIPTKPISKPQTPKSDSNPAVGTKKTTANKSTAQNILAINQKHYALQLVASSNEQKIKDFISSNGLKGKAHYFSGLRNGKPWYTVVYGDFPNKTAALANINKLPKGIQKLNPWVRSYSSIQSDIRKSSNNE